MNYKLFALVLLVFAGFASAAWYDMSFSNKQQFTQSVTLSASICGNGIVLPVNLSTTSLISTGNMSADCNATRWVNNSENFAFINYIENTTCNTGDTRAWVNFTCFLNGNNSGYLYYNNNATTTKVQSDPYAGDPAVKLWLDFSDGNKTQPVNKLRTDSNMSCTTVNPVYFTGAGISGQAVQFNDSGAFTCTQTRPVSSYITGNNTFTIEFVAKRDTNFQAAANYCALHYDTGGGYFNGLCGGAASNTTWLAWDLYDTANRRMYLQFADTLWHHWVLKSYGATTPYTREAWRDGSLVGTDTWNGLGDVTNNVRWFGGFTGSQNLSIDSILVTNDNKSIDWITARYNTIMKNNWLFGTPVSVTPNTLTISIVTPTNSTFLEANDTLNFSYISSAYTTVRCYQFLDGVNTNLGNVTNNTYKTNFFGTLAPKQHNATVVCENGASNSSSTVFFTNQFYRFTNSDNSPFTELQAYPIATKTSVAESATNVINITATLYWNNRTYVYFTGSAGGSDSVLNVSGAGPNFTSSKTIVPDLVVVNNSNITYQWTYNVTFYNGTSYGVNGTAATNPVYWAYYLNNAYNTPVGVYRGSNFTATFEGPNFTSGAFYTVYFITYTGKVLFNNTNFTATNTTLGSSTVYQWNTTLTAPNTTIANTSFNLNMSTLLNNSLFGYNTQITRLSGYANGTNGNSTQYVYVSALTTNCSAPNIVVLNFSYFSEENTTLSQNGTMEGTFTVYNPSGTVDQIYNLSFASSYADPICITSIPFNTTVDSIQDFNGTSIATPIRFYYLINATISPNSTQNVSLFLEPSTIALNTQFTILNANGLAMPNVYVYLERYYPALNQYLTVAMIKTGNDGKAVTYLRANDVYYKFVGYQSYQLISTWPTQQVSCPTGSGQCLVNLQVNPGSIDQYFNYASTLAYSCGYSSATNSSSCAVSDSSGTFVNYSLTVTKIGIASNTQVCYSQLSTPAGTLICTTNSPGQYVAVLQGNNPSYVISTFSYVNGTQTSLFGNGFLFLALLVVMAIGLLVIGSPAAAAFFTALGVLFGVVIGIITLSVTSIAALFFVAIVVAWKIRS